MVVKGVFIKYRHLIGCPVRVLCDTTEYSRRISFLIESYSGYRRSFYSDCYGLVAYDIMVKEAIQCSMDELDMIEDALIGHWMVGE